MPSNVASSFFQWLYQSRTERRRSRLQPESHRRTPSASLGNREEQTSGVIETPCDLTKIESSAGPIASLAPSLTNNVGEGLQVVLYPAAQTRTSSGDVKTVPGTGHLTTQEASDLSIHREEEVSDARLFFTGQSARDHARQHVGNVYNSASWSYHYGRNTLI